MRRLLGAVVIVVGGPIGGDGGALGRRTGNNKRIHLSFMAPREQSAADSKAPIVRAVLFDVTEAGVAFCFRDPETRFGERVGDLENVSRRL